MPARWQCPEYISRGAVGKHMNEICVVQGYGGFALFKHVITKYFALSILQHALTGENIISSVQQGAWSKHIVGGTT